MNQRVDDIRVREEILEVARKNKKEQQDFEEQARSLAEDYEKAALLKIGIQERRFRIYQSILARESVATMIGALVLLTLTAAVIAAMLSHTAIPELVSSAFLVIIGYFFGQTSARRAKPATKDDRTQ